MEEGHLNPEEQRGQEVSREERFYFMSFVLEGESKINC